MQYKLPTYDNIITIHEVALKIGGGLEGILHEDRIYASISRPQIFMQYDNDCDIHLVCAILLHALATGHAFTEGNKRTALLTILVTYNANNKMLTFNHLMNDEYKELVLWVVSKKPDVKKIAPKLKTLADKYAPNPIEAFIKQLSGKV